MNIFGLNFTSEQAVAYIKQHWKPGKREWIYIGIYAIILIVGTIINSTDIYVSGSSGSSTVTMPLDYNMMAARDYVIEAVDLFAFVALTFFYFKSSDKSVNNALKWGVSYAVPVALVNLASGIYYWSTMPKEYLQYYNPTLHMVSDVLYLPASFLTALLVAGGLYLFFVSKPTLKLTIIGYLSMAIPLIIFRVAINGGVDLYSGETLLTVVGLSLIGLYIAVKNQINFKPFPQVFLFGGIALGLAIFAWIADIPVGGYQYELVGILSFAVFGFILYFLEDKKIIQIGAVSAPVSPPPPPPPPPPPA